MLPTFHHLLSDFTKSLGLDLEMPPAEDLESFEFIHEGTRCMVRPAENSSQVLIEADALRLDSLPVMERSRALRFLHGLNRASLATNHFVATLDVDDEIRLSKSLPLANLTAAALADEMVAAVAAARSLARSLRILSEAENAQPEQPPEEPATASTIPCPLKLA